MTQIMPGSVGLKKHSPFHWRKSFAEHKALLLFVIVYNGLGLGLIIYFDPAFISEFAVRLFTNIKAFMLFIFASIAIFSLIHLGKKRPKGSPLLSIYRALRNGPLANKNIPRYLMAYLALIFTLTMFLKLKTMIPLMHPFAFDQSFESLDRALHFGHQPWELVQHLTGHPVITQIIHRLYYLWFPVILITFFWQVGTTAHPVLRQQFILSYLACWIIIGTVLATAFSSVGPIFYSDFIAGGEEPYATAMAYLERVHAEHGLLMFDIKDVLWAGYQGEAPNADIAGISAMPSMHVALAFLLVLFGWKYGNKWLAGAYTAFFACIMLGSIHLLWHYAVDGYVSILVTFAIWKGAGWVAKRSVAKAEHVALAS